MNNGNIINKDTFNLFYDKYAPVCYGLAVNKLGSKQAAQAIFKSVIVKLCSNLKVSDLATEAFQKEVCKTVQMEITSYKKDWALNELLSCRRILTRHS